MFVMDKNKISPMQMRAMFQPNTLNDEARTVEVTFATDKPILMRSWDGNYYEQLSFADGHVRMERLNNGAPLLDNHDRYGGTGSQHGVVERAWGEDGKGKAIIRFARDADSEVIFGKVKDGILRNISVGYRVYKYEEIKGGEEGIPTFRAIDWEPYEVSLAPVPADYTAQVRSQNEDKNDVVIIRQDKKMDKTPETTPQVDTEAIAKAAVEAERKRSSDIAAAVKKANLGEDFARKLIEGGVSIDQARAAIIDKFAESDTAKTRSQHKGASVGADEADKVRTGVTAALVLRSGQVDNEKLTKEEIALAAKYRGLSLMDLAKDSLSRAGISFEGMGKMEIAQRAISSHSSDFPVLLEGTNRRVLLANYQAVADTWRRFCTTGSVGDFREYKRLRMGTLSDLEALNENAEYKNKKITDADFEKISASTKGNIINISRKMIVNDDLSGFTRLASMLGRAAARSIENDVYALFALNSGAGPTMQDGNPLFHASHGNIATTAGAPTVEIIDGMRQQMAKQKDKDSNDFLDIRPELVVAPYSVSGKLREINAMEYNSESQKEQRRPNIVRGLFRDVIDTPRLSGTAYYMFANPSDEPVFEVVFLDGVQEPFMESEQPFDVDGLRWKIRLDYGVGAIGWRGAVKNAGA